MAFDVQESGSATVSSVKASDSVLHLSFCNLFCASSTASSWLANFNASSSVGGISRHTCLSVRSHY